MSKRIDVGSEPQVKIEAVQGDLRVVGWDNNGVPTSAKLQELDIEWVAEYISK